MARSLVVLVSVLGATCVAIALAWLLPRRESDHSQESMHAGQSATGASHAETRLSGQVASVDEFLRLLDGDREESLESLKQISERWHPGNRIMLVEVLRFLRNPILAARVLDLLQEKSGKKYGSDLHAWYQLVWNEDYQPHPNYAQFKSILYRRIDLSFERYFEETRNAKIRLDEILWGGVRRDGIPPLTNPETTTVASADYLQEDNIVFGVKIGEHARAYPKRILAWHEMVKDVVGEVRINGVYCTLCGSMIVYRTETSGSIVDLGTSGFLYRSNKLMYDQSTESLWSTLEGQPVVGPLVGENIRLEPLYVVTTTWAKWKQLHPETDVLTLNTGHRRDYSEGAAYRDYFDTDQLMFSVPKLDKRLKNKAEVFVVRSGETKLPIAFDIAMLNKRTVFHYTQGELAVVLVTDDSGAVRAYESSGSEFDRGESRGELVDELGRRWLITEAALTQEETAQTLKRVPGHRAFWFGWYASHPDTILVH